MYYDPFTMGLVGGSAVAVATTSYFLIFKGASKIGYYAGKRMMLEELKKKEPTERLDFFKEVAMDVFNQKQTRGRLNSVVSDIAERVVKEMAPKYLQDEELKEVLRIMS